MVPLGRRIRRGSCGLLHRSAPRSRRRRVLSPSMPGGILPLPSYRAGEPRPGAVPTAPGAFRTECPAFGVSSSRSWIAVNDSMAVSFLEDFVIGGRRPCQRRGGRISPRLSDGSPGHDDQTRQRPLPRMQHEGGSSVQRLLRPSGRPRRTDHRGTLPGSEGVRRREDRPVLAGGEGQEAVESGRGRPVLFRALGPLHRLEP